MIAIGVDVGAVSAQCAVIANGEDASRLCDLSDGLEGFSVLKNTSHETVLLSPYRRVHGNPAEAGRGLIRSLSPVIGGIDTYRIAFTGSGSYGFARTFGFSHVNEFSAVAKAISTLHPSTRTVFEMGGEDSKYMRLNALSGAEHLGIEDYEKNGDCAAGTGSFIDQQASRLRFDIHDIGPVVLNAGNSPTIAGRCSVFAKSDMIHAQQKGYKPPEILKGLCEAVARNFKAAITKGKEIVPPVAFIGGVASNAGVVEAIRSAFGLREDELFVPEAHAWMGAISAAITANTAKSEPDAHPDLSSFLHPSGSGTVKLPTLPALSMERVVVLRDRVRPFSFSGKREPVPVHLGIDIGSVSTNVVLIDDAGDVVHEIYTYTRSRPIEVVSESLRDIYSAVGEKVEVRSAGTTGSGRELIGLLIGADTINDEITAHKTGASFIGERLIDTKPDTIFEIGGQDSKFISLNDGIVVDFAMNEACAAGTGSFLEEQAEKLGVRIKDEFAECALRTQSPVRMGERCTVFMEKDVTSFAHQGADTGQICAGLAYSVVQNYLNRVVRGRHIGQHVFFQGGTAYNDAVAAAFSHTLDKPIIIPPHNGVIGAIGAAMLARDVVARRSGATQFRGWNIDSVDYTLREFTCKACSNACDMQEFTVEGTKTYWGDKCGERYRNRAKTDRTPVIRDLSAARMGELMKRYSDPAPSNRPRIGIPRAMYFYDMFPFWRAYFETIGADVVVSDTSSKGIVNAGVESVVAEPCFPIIVAHGHIQNLLRKQVDFIWVPNMIDVETESPEVNSFLCPWGQTLPWILRVAPRLSDAQGKLLHPTLHYRGGRDTVEREMRTVASTLGTSRRDHRAGIDAGYAALQRYRSRLSALGNEALETLHRSGERGIVLIGRPYNLYDPAVNLNVPTKLRTEYGINVIPMEFLPIQGIDIADVNDNMFWNYGRKILQAARFVSSQSHLRIIYITNFKCGPDSYIKTFASKAAHEPFLTLQFDGHANDAGTMTRCEAYLQSQGFFTHTRASNAETHGGEKVAAC